MNRALDKVSKSLKVKSSGNSKSILHNNFVLYTVFAIAIINFFSYLTVGDIKHTIIFLLAGFVTSFLSKNMVVILCIAMAVTNIVKVATSNGREGMEDQEDKEEEGMDDMDEKEEEGMEGMEDQDEKEEEGMDDMEDDKEEGMTSDGRELIEMQDKIINGFKEIEPYMEQAEQLANKLERTASQYSR
jgi:hypothetical protein